MNTEASTKYAASAQLPTEKADVVITGGGLAGLSLSIQLAVAGYKVVLFEKEKYPFHKVCGEYISMESWDHIQALGLPLSERKLPLIKKLMVTSPNGDTVESPLGAGGFGISRYLLDSELCNIARSNGVKVYEETKVNDIIFEKDLFTIHSSRGRVQSKIAVGAYGKRSNLDVKWSREFTRQKNNSLNNYLAVKYHINISGNPGTIALHNFENGYCGISQIEDDKYCLCYLTTAANLNACNNSIPLMEKNVLQKNPHLNKIFSEAKFLYRSPLTISQISFNHKSRVQNDVLMIGDAAGMITPLCGNGMSMAFHSGKLAFACIDRFLKTKITKTELQKEYNSEWNRHFAKRLAAGRMIQRFFGKTWMTNIFIGTIKHFPIITRQLISLTHGNPF